MALIKCKECGKEISSKAKSCPNCGNPIATKNKKKSNGCLPTLLLIFFGLIFIGVMSSNSSKTPEEKAAELKRQRLDVCNNPFSAYRFAKDFIKLTLKSPASAQFPDYSSQFIKELPDCTYVINSYVDAQNGFGALIRSVFTVKVKYNLNTGKWELLEQNFVK